MHTSTSEILRLNLHGISVKLGRRLHAMINILLFPTIHSLLCKMSCTLPTVLWLAPSP
jgi:hypothetical protein